MDVDEIKLETLGDVRRALARLYHRIDRHNLDLEKAKELRQTLRALLEAYIDRRDSRYQQRLKAVEARLAAQDARTDDTGERSDA